MAGSQTAWGLDVGVTSLKAIKLRKDGDLVSVEAFDVVEHEKFLSEPDVNRDEMIRQTLIKFLQRHPIRRERVFIGVPGSSTFARFVKLPPVEPKKVPEIVRFEAIQQIPFPLDQVNWDYHTFQSPESPDVEVGIFAMKKELVAQVLSNFRAVGLTIHGVQMSPLAIYNAAAFDGMTDDKGTVLIDMGAEHTDLVILDQGRLWLRTVNIGGNHFTDALAKSFKQSFNRAEQLKKTAATSKYQKQIFQAMRPIFADLVAEIQRSIGHYNSGHRDSKLERIVGMGNPFKLPNLQKYLQQELKMEVIRLDNFKKVKSDGKLAAGFNEGILGMTAAYGLAVQGLGLVPIDTNLLPIELARQMMWKNKQPWFIGSAAAIVLAVGGVWLQYYSANKAFAATQGDELATNNRELQDAQSLKDNYGKLNAVAQYQADKAAVDQFMDLAKSRAIWPQLNLDILAALPQAKNPTSAKAPGSKVVVLTSISSEYHDKLMEISTNGGSAVLANPGMEAVQPGIASNPDNPDAAPPPPPPPPPPSAAAVAVGPSERGFVISITGYAPPVSGVEGFRVAAEFKDAIMERAKLADKDKPYYFTEAGMSGLAIMRPGAGMSGNAIRGPWGNAFGPFREFYALEVAGIHQTTRPAETGGEVTSVPVLTPSDLGGPIDAFIRNPDRGPQYMYDDFSFQIQFKVHVR